MMKQPESENTLNTLHKTPLLAAATCALFALPAWASDVVPEAPVTANISIENNYIYRGISRTNGNPAIQGGVDLSADNGVYVGVWGSNISWLTDKGMATSSSLEADFYFGIKNTFATDFNYDFGILRYQFPGIFPAGMVNADTNEIHAGIGYDWLALKYSYAVGNAFGIDSSSGSHYLDLSADIPISDTGVSLGAHYGKQVFVGAGAAQLIQAGMDPSYADWKVSLSWGVAGWTLGAAYSGANTHAGGYYTNNLGNNMGRKAGVISLRRTF